MHLIDHPLVQQALTRIRDKATSGRELRFHVDRITAMLTYEALRDLPMARVEIETPFASATGSALPPEARIAIVPVLRAGLAMVEAALRCAPQAEVWHLGAYRDPESLKPVSYYNRLPRTFEGTRVLLLDGTIATGGTMIAAMDLIDEKQPVLVSVVTLVSAKQGLDNLLAAHPGLEVYVAAIDPELSTGRAAGRILPGVGELSDRLYGTR